MRRMFEPIVGNLIKVSGATKKKIPDNDERLKQIKQGLVAIGNHINGEMRNKDDKQLEDKLWGYVSEHYWPQSKSDDKRVPGDKLRDMYKKIAGKDLAKDQAKNSTPSAPASGKATNGATASVKAEKTEPAASAEQSIKPDPAQA
jgi:chromodomain-helicase-DNA-binding protein 1